MSRRDLVANGKPVRLGRMIGRGGEGTVYEIADTPDLAVKLYTKPDRERETKIEAMVAAKLHERSGLIAFPVATVRGQNGDFAGFTMRLVKGCQPLFELYAPGARKKSFPKADYRFLIHAARNIAIAVSHVHDAGCIIGDINHSGILISDKAMAALIDADSFQFGDKYRCRVGVPEYTPPELQGMSLAGIHRTPTHDAFGLAVVIFQMLFMGRHPYVGKFARGDVTIQEAIASGQFIYARSGSVAGQPPPASASLGDFPSDLGSLFERAFDRNFSDRPNAKAWVGALAALEQSLSHCTENELHYFPSAARNCLWCRLEKAAGVSLFEKPLPQGSPARDPGAANFDLKQVWRAIAAVRIPREDDLQPNITLSALEPGEEVREILKSRRSRVNSGITLMIAAAIVGGFDLALWFHYVPLGLWGYHRIYSRTPQPKITDRYRRSFESYHRALDDWHRRIGLHELHTRRRELEAARTRFGNLAEARKRELASLHSQRQQIQLRRHLERYRIQPGCVNGVGRGKIATLASYGIDTAADIDRGRILSLQGFGPVTAQALANWKKQLTSLFRYNRSATPQDKEDEQRIERKFADEARKLRQMLSGGAAELQRAAFHVFSQAARPDPTFQRHANELEQAKVDAEALGMPLPDVAIPGKQQLRAAPQSSSGLRSTRSSTPAVSYFATPSCPKCRRQMVKRLARRGRNRGNHFWGCSRYPSCKGTRPI